MSRVLYGNVELSIVKTNVFDMEAVYDSSGTDFIGIKFTLDVAFVLNPAATSYTTGPLAGAGVFPAPTTKAIRQYLLTPRRTLVFDIAGFELLRCPQAGMATDAITGPKPIRCTVVRVDGARTFMGNYRIECMMPECSGTNPSILSHRWSEQHIIDERFATTRVVMGEVIFNRAALDAENPPKVADDYRHHLAHPVPNSFQRRRIEVAENPSGTVIQYQIRDEQQDYCLGANSPAVKIDATFAVMSNYGQGNNQAANKVHFSGTAIGEPTADRLAMFRQLVRVALGRLKLGNRFAPKADIIVAAQAKEHLTTQAVALDIIAVRQPDQAKGIVFPGLVAPPDDGEFLARDCGAIKYAEGVSPFPIHGKKARGSWNANLAAAALGTPCTSPTSAGPVPRSFSQDNTQETNIEISVAQHENIAPGQIFNVVYSEETEAAGIYTDVKMDITYLTKDSKFQVPVAGQTTSSPGNIRESDKECVVLQYAHPVTTKVVEWTAERLGAKPKVPKPRGDNPLIEVLDHTVKLASYEIVADGSTEIWRASGKYSYALLKSVEAGVDELKAGLLPIYEDIGETSYLPEDFSGEIIEGGGTGSEFRTS